MNGVMTAQIRSLTPAVQAAYLAAVATLAADLIITGGHGPLEWLLLMAATAPFSFLAAPAAATLLAGHAGASSLVMEILLGALWVALWVAAARINVALLSGPRRRFAPVSEPAARSRGTRAVAGHRRFVPEAA
ncbi:MAG: hypothetical protein ACT4P1_15645 [Sporichthyaceae bacterium]